MQMKDDEASQRFNHIIHADQLNTIDAALTLVLARVAMVEDKVDMVELEALQLAADVKRAVRRFGPNSTGDL
jgi:hypothetical protein